MTKQKIAVLFGGCSPEYDVSLKSAYSVIINMDRDKFEPVMLGITRAGAWFLYTGEAPAIADNSWNNSKDCLPAIISPSRETRGVLVFRGIKTETIRIDAAMPVLHGRFGEDGTVQGLLELAGIPVIGCGILSSALCLDKHRAHKTAEAAGIKAPRAFVLGKSDDTASAYSIADSLGYPVFVKPVKSGSSFGITKVSDSGELEAAISLALNYDDEAIIEETILGFEVGCAVFGSRELKTGLIDEIEISGGFFDHTEKYLRLSSKIHLPARICPETAQKITETAKRIYRALGCSGFARVDMFLTPEGDIVFNEVNTIPGLTECSRFPNMLTASGLSFKQLVTTVIEEAVTHEDR